MLRAFAPMICEGLIALGALTRKNTAPILAPMSALRPGIAQPPPKEPAEAPGALSPGSPLEALRDLSARLGGDPLLVQGAGGNTSVKQGSTMWIKASGTRLADARDRPIFLQLDLEEVRRRCRTEEEPDWSGLADEAGRRPSIETPLHALLPRAVVLHVHSVRAIAHVVLRDARERLGPLLQGMDWAFVPYARPGAALTDALSRAIADQSPQPRILVLQNHGLVVAADSCAHGEALLKEVERRLEVPARPAPAPPVPGFEAWVRAAGWALPRDPGVHGLALDPTSLAAARQGPLYPDHVVFLGPGLPELTPDEALGAPDAPRRAAEAHARRQGVAPLYLVMPGHGVLLRPEISLAAQEMLSCLAEVARRIEDQAAVRGLGPAEVAALGDWDAEKHRQALGAQERHA